MSPFEFSCLVPSILVVATVATLDKMPPNVRCIDPWRHESVRIAAIWYVASYRRSKQGIAQSKTLASWHCWAFVAVVDCPRHFQWKQRRPGQSIKYNPFFLWIVELAMHKVYCTVVPERVRDENRNKMPANHTRTRVTGRNRVQMTKKVSW